MTSYSTSIVQRLLPRGVFLSFRKVENVNKHGMLLEIVQVLADLDLVITKAYITLDGRWFMDVFNVTYRDESKVIDEGVVNYLKESFFRMRLRRSAIRAEILANSARIYKLIKKWKQGGDTLPTEALLNVHAEDWAKYVKHITSPEYIRRSNANKGVRAKQTIIRDPVTQQPPGLIKEYARIRLYKGALLGEVAANYERMKKLECDQVGAENPLSENDILQTLSSDTRGRQT